MVTYLFKKIGSIRSGRQKSIKSSKLQKLEETKNWPTIKQQANSSVLPSMMGDNTYMVYFFGKSSLRS